MGSRLHLSAVFVAALFGALPSARASDPPASPWEQEVERETEEQSRLLEQAQRAKTVPAIVRKYESLVGLDPSALNHFLLGRAQYYNEDLTGARTQMGLALKADPGFWPAHVKLARLAADLKNWKEADAEVKAALAAKPSDSEALEVTAQIGLAQKDWSRAIRAFEALVAKDPGNIQRRLNLASIHLASGNPDAARLQLNVLLAHDPKSFDVLRLLAKATGMKGDRVDAAARLETLFAEPNRSVPEKLLLLDDLREQYVKLGDRDRVRQVLERAVPLLPPEGQKALLAMIEKLRHPPETADAPKAPTPEDLFALAESTDVVKRREGLRMVFEASELGYLRQIPRTVLMHAVREYEPDVECRSWAVKILSTPLEPPPLAQISLALWDEAREVQMLAADGIGAMGRPAGIAYLLPFVWTPDLDLLVFNSIRAALSALTRFRDLPIGTDRVSTEAEAVASRGAWRGWAISDASTPLKLAAIRELRVVDKQFAERFLYDFVMDATFDVMREAFFAMRAAVAREPRDTAEKKVFPLFPVVADAEVTRETMRAVQDRVAQWWEVWMAEHRALLQATGK